MKHCPEPSLSDEVNFSFAHICRFWSKRNSEQPCVKFSDVLAWCAHMFPPLARTPFLFSRHSHNDMGGCSVKGPSLTSSKSFRSSSSSDVCQIEQVGSDVQWQLSQGSRGHLHLVVGDQDLACGRTLHRPECGRGLESALATGRQWSPRCKRALLDPEVNWWNSAHKVQPSDSMGSD
jgi:hypothetical protein